MIRSYHNGVIKIHLQCTRYDSHFVAEDTTQKEILNNEHDNTEDPIAVIVVI